MNFDSKIKKNKKTLNKQMKLIEKTMSRMKDDN